MKEWLRGKNIPFNEGLLKPEIYELIKHHKPPKEYVVDRKIEAAGHMVLRLPPYHCDLNPIENIWGIIKNEVAMNNTSFKLADMKVLTDQAIKNVDPTTIKNTMEHVKMIVTGKMMDCHRNLQHQHRRFIIRRIIIRK